MSAQLRVIQYGLGPIGQACVRYINDYYSDRIVVVGAVDIDPEKIGQDLGRVCGLDRDLDVPVSATLEGALRYGEVDVVLHTTASSLELVSGQLEECLRAGLSVVSSTEELSYPWIAQPERSLKLDAVAREHGVGLVGTGVNPGFVMDSLALMASAASAHVESIRIQRVVDAGIRRLPLQRKVGFGLTPQEFADRKAAGLFGHIGLKESAQMVAAGLGWNVEDLEETLEPQIDESMLAANGSISNCVLGIRQHVHVRTTNGRHIELGLHMYVGATDPGDTIEIAGDPPLRVTIPGGVFGDTATVAMLINTLPRIRAASPGLKTMLDLPLPRAFGGIRSERAEQALLA